MIQITEDQAFTLLSCTVRYALGRSSYVVGEACDLIRSLVPHLTPAQRSVIQRDIETAPGYGMDMDRTEWMRSLEDLKAMGARP